MIKKILYKLFPALELPKDFRHLLALPRYQPAETKIFSKTISIVDQASFLCSYREIFDQEIYRFRTDAKHPRIIDCGSNIGLSIIYFKRLYPESQVIGFEPDPVVFKVLENNIKSFQFEDVCLLRKGLWSSKKRLNFFSEGADGGRIAVEGDSTNIVSIETDRLRDYLDEDVDFLKLDIEGAEAEVLTDCRDKLSRVKNLFVEYHSFFSQEQSLHKTLDILTHAGFRYYIRHLGAFSPKPFLEINSLGGVDLQLNIYAYRV